MKCDGSGVSSLKKDGLNYSDCPVDQLEILNQQFVSSFTREDHNSLPQMCPGLSETHSHSVKWSEEASRRTEYSQTSRPDQLSPSLLKEMAPSVAPALIPIFEASYD